MEKEYFFIMDWEFSFNTPNPHYTGR